MGFLVSPIVVNLYIQEVGSQADLKVHYYVHYERLPLNRGGGLWHQMSAIYNPVWDPSQTP